MRTVLVAVLVALGGILSSQPAEAGHTRVTVGVGFGFGYPFWGPYPWYAPPPYYYYPAPVVVRAEPVTYVEQGSSQPAPAVQSRAGWWYYCESSKGYYPYVKECPSGWRRVAPTPAR